MSENLEEINYRLLFYLRARAMLRRQGKGAGSAGIKTGAKRAKTESLEELVFGAGVAVRQQCGFFSFFTVF